MTNITIIPIDNRPICYDIINDILAIDKNINVSMPDIKLLGDLKKGAFVDELLKFLENSSSIDYLIICLDTLAYGGLIPSRRCEDSFFEIKERIEKFKEIALKKAGKILGFSSIMRISNNNINEEEKDYWSTYGKKIFDYSYNLHKNEVEKTNFEIKNDIPKEILDDYLKTRSRNFEINKLYLSWAKEGFFDTLIFSKDDCAPYGFNVKEALELEKLVKKDNLSNVKIKTGADEIPLSLISRALCKKNKLKINPIFLQEKSKNLISKYEDISIENCVLSQIKMTGCEVNYSNPDLNFIINNFKNEQGDHVLGDVIKSFQGEFPNYKKYFIADVNNANGADRGLIEELFKQSSDELFSYCGYNTSANTIGASLLIAIVKFLALKNDSFNEQAFKKIMFIRFLDDWAYQALNRKSVQVSSDFKKALEEKIDELNICAEKISKFLNYYPKKVKYSLPWDRSFEIRIEIS